jgi:Fur family zinc uptake transcriptional regulator
MADPSADAPQGPGTFPGPRHDHDHCIETALEDAESVCSARNARLTTLRRRVLEIVWQSHQPLGAYAILDELGRDGRRAAPPTVYRALEFLLSHGLVHRIASLNAYVGCSHPGHAAQGQFLICTQCANTVEMVDDTVASRIGDSARALGFAPAGYMVEVTGLCPDCTPQAHRP